MNIVRLRVNSNYIADFQKMLENHGAEFSYVGGTDEFLPEQWVEILVPLTPILVKILYDIWKKRQDKTEVQIQIDDTYVKVNAEEIEKLTVRLKKAKKRKRKLT